MFNNYIVSIGGVDLHNNMMENLSDRSAQIEDRLQKLKKCEENCSRLWQQYTIVQKQSEISCKTVPVGCSWSSKNQIQGKSSQTKEWDNEKDKYESVRKCIFQFYRDRSDLNVLNGQSNAEVKQFLKRLDKSNGEMWQSHTKKTSIVKLERIIN